MTDRRMIDGLLEALKFSPDNMPLKKQVAELLYEGGYETEAMPMLKEVVQQAWDSRYAMMLANAQIRAGQFLEAGSVLTRLISLESRPDAMLALAEVNYNLGEYQQADDMYRKAVAADPRLSETAVELREKLNARLGAHPPTPIPVMANTPMGFEDLEADPYDDRIVHSDITFEDVGGLDDLKESIHMNIIYPFKHPELYMAYGKKAGGGLLLYGPPGCGKTHIARATAGECGAYFLSLALHEILDMYIGQSEKNLHEIFELARRNKPTVIFIDELDALGGAREHGQSRHDRSLTNQLLMEMDGIHSRNDGILVMGATNTPWFLDPALKRPGRFDRVLFVPPPDQNARARILQIHLSGKPIEGIDYDKLAKSTDKYSGADLKAICDMAAEEAIKESIKSGRQLPIGMKHLTQALKQVKPSTLEWMATAKNYATYSNQGGTYDDVLEYLKRA